MNTNQDEKINIIITKPPITSLTFEGGGVKGIAYVGAYRALKEKMGFLDRLHWVAGSSAGAMTALLIALNFTVDEIETELTKVNFSEFAEPLPSGKLATINYIYKNIKKIANDINHGINSGKKLYQWIQMIVEKKLGNKQATFLELKSQNEKQKKYELEKSFLGFKNLFVVVTNAMKKKSEVFSWETTPNMQIADAVLASMSIPGFFYLRYIDAKMHKIDWNPTQEKIINHKIIPYVDGGVLNNYPINIFQSVEYWEPGYYELAEHPHSNPSSLGIRVDPKEEVLDLIEIRRLKLADISDSSGINLLSVSTEDVEEKIEPKKDRSDEDTQVKSAALSRIIYKLINLLTSDLDKVAQYCQMTIEIDDCNIKTTNFELTEKNKHRLKQSGKKSVNAFLNEYLGNCVFTKISYKNLSELEEAVRNKGELIRLLNTLKKEGLYGRTRESLEFVYRLSKEKLLEISKQANVPSLFFVSNTEASTSEISPISADNPPSEVVQESKDEIVEAQNLFLNDSEPLRTSIGPISPKEEPIDVLQQELEDPIERNRTSAFKQFCFCL